MPAILRDLDRGQLRVTFPNGDRTTIGSANTGPEADVRINDERFFRHVLVHGEIGFAEAYMDRLWETDDLVTVLQLALENRQKVDRRAAWLAGVSGVLDRRRHVLSKPNSLDGSRRNITFHYDLSNDFYKLWLDESLIYSCAVWNSPEETLEQAQRNKCRMLSEKAVVCAGQRILDIGGGWGAYARFAAATYGCHVRMANVSRAQVELARELVAREGLDHLVDVQFQDYREVEGPFDAIVVMGMIEQVGADYYRTFFECVDRCLKPGGRFVLQTITVPDESFAALRDGVNFMQKYIFPGGMLPSLAAIREASAGTSLVIRDIEEIGPHYVRTMHEWRARFWANIDAIKALGFDDERFIRMWDYYLASSEACFITRTTGDSQIIFEKPG
ncbi:MAG TPA: cyclopropane-fatty-acyl-phospholipid synthase family protein [Dehalococcoidia bacterium]|nr:cyclopropane-fatty-acyl-phospholipid synthase family protein [Dehalococcoidia bacterium]